MGLEPDEAIGTVQLSLGRLVMETQIPEVARLLVDAWWQSKGS